jgi:Ca2+-binding EF-hand superfamily protein
MPKPTLTFNQDTDKGGNITVEEFGRVMKQSGQNPSEEELAQIIKEVDIDGDGTINFDGRSFSHPNLVV